MIILGRSHDNENQGARTPDGLSEWMIADTVNAAIQDEIKYRCDNRHLVMRLGGTLADRISILQQIGKVSRYDCAVECHCNAFTNTVQHGFSVLAWHTSGPSLHLASCILEQVARVRPDSRNMGVCTVASDPSTPERDTIRWVGGKKEYGKASWLGLLADTPGPAVIVEACYLTNPVEAFWISEFRNRQALGWAIGRGVDNWLKESKEKKS